MIAGVPRETHPGERRVALVPAGVPLLSRAGIGVLVEAGAGEGAGFPDAAYAAQGARIVPGREALFSGADLLLRVRALGADPGGHERDLALSRPGQAVAGLADPLDAPGALLAAARRGLTVLSLDLLPRTTRAQPMDALSAMATVAGYKAVVLAAASLPRLFPLLMTAAGTLSPARVLVLGAGVAGLTAIATARRLGAVVQAYDVRPSAREQVESVGARFVALPLEAGDAEDRGGYARDLGPGFHRAQRELLAPVVAASDVVVASAFVPGRPAPVLVTGEMVAAMPAGSVFVDLAAARGGNCDVTRPGETVVHRGVTVIAAADLPATVPGHASQMLSRNLCAFVLHLFKDGRFAPDPGDEIARGTIAARDGEVVHPAVLEALRRTAPDR